ncbi:hypothetical protein PAXRUDRAFT_829848 [Paxillus rubicundulus Ve08.2h10]|uniref:XPG-I domain-containing protein n=1 Tax=Paxillus rubicundulus Ve08.2h10 TaxID=930991 RepID=A0A0D0D6S7_9AGAM|nr:hypothetical protein PAXRUDRAFT_829848 [Paxillus rubicundulus Ve08.2h10]
MGIKGLWKIISPACKIQPLCEFAVVEGFRRGTEPGSEPVLMRIGVDGSTWMHEACTVFQHNHAGAGPSPELWTLFYRLARLHKVACHAHFVFDGKDRPATKQGKRVKIASHFLARGFQELIVAFWFMWHTAPGEAEAELAMMNHLARIDAVFTSDSDTFVFGAQCVMWSTDAKPTTICVKVCTDDALLHGVGLPQSELILLVLCRRGDYDQTGLSGCGSEIASWLTRYLLGKSLVNTIWYESAVGLCKFLAKWCSDLCNILACDPSGFLGQKYPRLAEAVPDDFLDINVLVQYVEPLASWSSMNWREHQPVGVVQSHQVDFVRLAAICEACFEWSSVAIQAKFWSDLWEGACMHALCQLPECLSGSYDLIFKILEYVPVPLGGMVATYRAYLTSSPLITAAYSGINMGDGQSMHHDTDSVTCSVPSGRERFAYICLLAPILEYLKPAALKMFRCEKGLPPLLSPKPLPLLPASKWPSGSQHIMTAANGRGNIIDLMKPTVTEVMNTLHGRLFPESEYKVIDLTAE